MRVSLKLPGLVYCLDQDGIADVWTQLSYLTSKPVKVVNLGFDEELSFSYVGLVYVGRRPAKKVVDAMLAKEGIRFNKD